MRSRLGAFLKNTWVKEPVLVASFTIRGLGVILPSFSPYTKHAAMINQVAPYNYTVPVRDHGNMPSHPQGPRLEWLKKLSTSTERLKRLPSSVAPPKQKN